MTAILHSSGSHSTRQSAEPMRVPFSLSTAPNLVHALGSFAEPELPPQVSLAIPELWSFDQEELNDNPVFNELCPMPLIGALLLDRQLITRAQLDICLLLQAQTHPNLPIGQILILKGYISQTALDHALSIQAEIRSTLNDKISQVGPTSFT